jgi:hypothetical protein
MLPDFLKTATRRSAFVGAGDIIQVGKDVDLGRIGQCKSKKAKGVYELMRTFRVGEVSDSYQQGLVVLQQEIGLLSWARGQIILNKKRGNSMLRGNNDEDEEEEDSRKRNPAARFIKRQGFQDILTDFSKAASSLTSLGLSSGANAAAGQEENNEGTKTLKEILEEREEQMKDIEQL